MKTGSLIALTLVCLVCVTCKNADEPCLSVPTTAPLNQVNLKFIDKTTGADLIFGPGAPYKVSDLQVASSRGYQAQLLVDSAQKSNPFVFMIVEGEMTQSLTLKLGALPADTINTIFTTTRKSRCYSYTDLSTIDLDGKTICNPCSTAIQLVTIKK